jgi:hypothetical protein
MKRAKKLYVLLGVLVVVCIVTIVVSRIQIKREEIKNSDEIILELPTDSVESLSWTYNDTSFAFHKDGTWLYDEDEAFPVDETAIESLLEQFESFGVSFVIEDVEDYGQYGLDDPECTIQLTADGTDYEIDLGTYSTMDEERYVSIGDGNVYLVTHDPLDDFDVELSDLICNDTTPGFSGIAEVSFTGEENYSFSYVEEGGNSYREADVYYVTQDGTQLPLDTSRVSSYLSKIKNLDLSDYVTYNATEEELASYGLDNPALTVTVAYIDSEDNEGTFVLNLGCAPTEETDADAEADEDEETELPGYVRVGDSQIVYEISASDYAALTAAGYDSFRHLEVVPADFDSVSQIDVTLDGETYSILAETNEDEETIYTLNGEEIDIADLESALESLSADSFTSSEPTEKTEISLTLTLNLEGEPQISIDLYRNDGSTCIAVVDGSPVSLVERSAVVDLIEAVNALVL